MPIAYPDPVEGLQQCVREYHESQPTPRSSLVQVFTFTNPDGLEADDDRQGDQPEEQVLESRHGQASLRARVGHEVAPGQVFCAFHFPDETVNSLTSQHADTATSCPEYKVTAVDVSPDPDGQAAHAPVSRKDRG